MKKITSLITLILLGFLLSACATTPPKSPNNAYHIFKEKPRWYFAADKSSKRYDIPVSVLMAIVHQESSFVDRAKPPRTKLLWVIPWKRKSSASGYSQALEGTWKEYQQKSGYYTANRHDFDDAINFVAWFSRNAVRELELDPHDAKNIYLAYHEGIGGYRRGTYLKKPQLVRIASKVQRRANHYEQQLQKNAHRLPRKHWWQFWL